GGLIGASPPICSGPTSTPSGRSSAAAPRTRPRPARRSGGEPPKRPAPAAFRPESAQKLIRATRGAAQDGWTSRPHVTILWGRIAHLGRWSHVARLGNRGGPVWHSGPSTDVGYT